MATITEVKRMHDPAHPGEILLALYLEPMKITITEAAEALGISRKHLSEIINGKSAVSPDMAMRLATALGTEPDLWINLQAQFDIWTVTQGPKPKVRVLKAA